MTDNLAKRKLVDKIYKILNDALDCSCAGWRSVAERQEYAISRALEMLRELQESLK